MLRRMRQSRLLNFFLVFAMRENVAFCLCFGLFDSLEICCNFVGICWIARWSSQSSLLNFFFDESRLLNFFPVFAMREKTLHFANVLACLTRCEFVRNSSDCVFQSGGHEKQKKKNWAELRSARRHKTSHFGRGGAIYIYICI